MKYFEEIQNDYKVNLIAGGRHFLTTGTGYIKRDGKFKKGKYYIFTDLFTFGKNSKIFSISLKDSFIVGEPIFESAEGNKIYSLDIKHRDKRMTVGFDSVIEMNDVTKVLFEQIQILIPSVPNARASTLQRKRLKF